MRVVANGVQIGATNIHTEREQQGEPLLLECGWLLVDTTQIDEDPGVEWNPFRGNFRRVALTIESETHTYTGCYVSDWARGFRHEDAVILEKVEIYCADKTDRITV